MSSEDDFAHNNTTESSSAMKKPSTITFDATTKNSSEPIIGHKNSISDHPVSSSGTTTTTTTTTGNVTANTQSQPQAPIMKHKQLPVATTTSVEEENTKIQALSNLRCPSPPPILNKPSPSIPLTSTESSLDQSQSQGPSQAQISVPQAQANGILKQSNTSPPLIASQQQQQQQQQNPPSILVASNPGSPSLSRGDEMKSPVSVSSTGSFSRSSASPVHGHGHGHGHGQGQGNQKDTIPAGGAILRGRAAAQAVVAAVAAQTARNRQGLTKLEEDALIDSGASGDDVLTMDNLRINEIQASHHKAPSMHAHFYVDEALKHGAAVTSRSRSGSQSANGDSTARVVNTEQFHLDSNHNLVKKVTTSVAPGAATDNTSNEVDSLAAATAAVPLPNTSAQPPMNGVASSTTTSTAMGQPAGYTVAKQTVDARLASDDNKLHVLFGICGTVSTKKTRLIINKLEEIYGSDKISIQIIITPAAEHFVSRGEFPTSVQIWRDKDEWTTWGGRSDPVLHIELRRWADILVIAPLTSNTLSKIALGLCDNLLTNVVRAWNTQYPILVAPSMVSYAYNSPITKRHLKVIKEEMKWIEILRPTEKVIGSYGDIGMGGIMDWNEIVKTICRKAEDLGFKDNTEDEDDDDEDEEEDEEDEEEEEELEKDKVRSRKDSMRSTGTGTGTDNGVISSNEQQQQTVVPDLKKNESQLVEQQANEIVGGENNNNNISQKDNEEGDMDEDNDEDDEDDEDDDDDDDDGIKISVADEDEIAKLLRK